MKSRRGHILIAFLLAIFLTSSTFGLFNNMHMHMLHNGMYVVHSHVHPLPTSRFPSSNPSHTHSDSEYLVLHLLFHMISCALIILGGQLLLQFISSWFAPFSSTQIFHPFIGCLPTLRAPPVLSVA
ncbi:hypothetical protein JW960_01365 [candidate division KSB1 bacterium]|nr:hypothetical protein [candidate division KSB1 bacterium]